MLRNALNEIQSVNCTAIEISVLADASLPASFAIRQSLYTFAFVARLSYTSDIRLKTVPSTVVSPDTDIKSTPWSAMITVNFSSFVPPTTSLDGGEFQEVGTQRVQGVKHWRNSGAERRESSEKGVQVKRYEKAKLLEEWARKVRPRVLNNKAQRCEVLSAIPEERAKRV
ncbi:hypothetical protein U1Q18_050399 [Sarracenia purpurea var. burkii]